MRPSTSVAGTVSWAILWLIGSLALIYVPAGAAPPQKATQTLTHDTLGTTVPVALRINPLNTIKVPSSNPVRTIRFQFRAGSMLDVTGMEGVSQLAARILAHRLTPESKRAGADFKWIQDKEWAAFEFSTTHAKKLGPWVRFATYLEKAPSAEEFKKAVNDQRESLSRNFKPNQDDNTLLLLQEFQNYRRSYRFPLSGTLTSLSAINSEDVLEFWKGRYTQAGLVLFYSDNLPHSEFEEITHNLQALEIQSNDAFIFNAPARLPDKTLRISKYTDCSSNRLAAGFPLLIDRRHQYYVALLMAEFSNTDFKLKCTGFPQKNIGMNQGNSFGSSSFDLFAWGLDRQILLCQISTEKVLPGQLELSLSGMILDFSAWAKKGLSQAQFQDSQSSLLQLLESIKKSQRGPLCNAAFSLQNSQSNGYINELINTISRLNLSDVNEAIKKVLTPQGLECTILSNENGLPNPGLRIQNENPLPISGKWPFKCTMEEASDFIKSCMIERADTVPLSPAVVEVGASLVK